MIERKKKKVKKTFGVRLDPVKLRKAKKAHVNLALEFQTRLDEIIKELEKD